MRHVRGGGRKPPPRTCCIYKFFIQCFFSMLHNSRTQSTSDEPRIIITQSTSFSPVTLKNCCKPGISTMAICPTRIIVEMNSNPLHPLKWSALRPVSNARAQKR